MTTTTEAPTSALAEYNRTAAELADLRQRFAGVVWDMTTTKGNAVPPPVASDIIAALRVAA